MSELEKMGPATFLLPKIGGMRVPGLVFGTEELLKEIDKSLDQVRNVAYLPGIVGYSIAMPDMHWGYGFPIGGVAGTDAKEGVISPGGVGYDINCGVRLALIPEPFAKITKETREKLLQAIFARVPSGVGHGHRSQEELTERDYAEIAAQGARYSVALGMGRQEDLDHTESHGVIAGGDIGYVSAMAKERGKKQLGSIGSGNHFIEIGAIEQILSKEIAEEWGIAEGMTYLLIHSGSRGFGHQVCQDTLDQFFKKGFAENLPDRQLVAAPIQSPEGKAYFAAMAAAANFAFNNRQQILHGVREAIRDVLGLPHEKVRLLYDVCHNIAKFEEHEVGGKKKKLCVHRKGATRAFGPGEEELAPIFRGTGQPVLIPGDMGRASYLLVGKGNPLSWKSCCHGAGRAHSRVQALKEWKGRDPIAYMQRQGVSVMASSLRTIAEEMPDAYKDVSAVVSAVEEAGLAGIVAKLKPSLVVKG